MPNKWVCKSHEEFTQQRPQETECPWQDLGCTRFLNSVNFEYACNLEGVYRSRDDTFVASTFASGGDLFDVACAGASLSPGRERELSMAPLVLQLFSAVQQL